MTRIAINHEELTPDTKPKRVAERIKEAMGVVTLIYLGYEITISYDATSASPVWMSIDGVLRLYPEEVQHLSKVLKHLGRTEATDAQD